MTELQVRAVLYPAAERVSASTANPPSVRTGGARQTPRPVTGK